MFLFIGWGIIGVIYFFLMKEKKQLPSWKAYWLLYAALMLSLIQRI